MITCFGEVLVDCLPSGNVVGGAPFNVAIHLERYGQEVCFLSRIGADSYANQILDLIKDSKLKETLQQDDDYKTGFVSVAFEDGEPQYTIHTNVAWQHINVPTDLVSDYIVFGSLGTYFDHNKKSLNQLITQSPKATKFCDINLRTPFYDRQHVLYCLEHADILKINEVEEEYVRNTIGASNLDEMVQVLKEKFNIETVLITRGEKNVEVFDQGKSTKIDAIRVDSKEFKDPIGAGDSFAATFIHESLQGKDIKTAVEKGIHFAAQICKVHGALPEHLALYKDSE